jgi:hypothetical protein
MKTIYNIQQSHIKDSALCIFRKKRLTHTTPRSNRENTSKFWYIQKQNKRPIEFSKIFRIGDWAEYDSYNLSYDGKICSIGEKSVTIEAYPGSKCAEKHRLDLWSFCLGLGL